MRLKEKPIFYSICSCNDRDSLVGYSVVDATLACCLYKVYESLCMLFTLLL